MNTNDAVSQIAAFAVATIAALAKAEAQAGDLEAVKAEAKVCSDAYYAAGKLHRELTEAGEASELVMTIVQAYRQTIRSNTLACRRLVE